MASRKQIRTAVLAGLGILFLGLLYASSQLSPGALPLTPAERRAQEMAQELEARRVDLTKVDKIIEEKDNAMMDLAQQVQSLRRELDMAREAAAAPPPPPAAAPAPQTARGKNNPKVLGPEDAPPPIVDSLYKRVHGIEPWEKERLEVLALHNVPTDAWLTNASLAVDSCDVSAPFEYETEEITLVTALLDLGRGSADSGTFKRPMTEYFNRFQKILDRGFKMIVYMPSKFIPSLKIDTTRVTVVDFDVEKLKTYFPYWDRLHAIRKSALWQAQASYIGYLKTAPQNKLEGYNPLVMSKLLLLRDAAISNPYKTKYQMWVDAGHFCAYDMEPTKIKTFTELMDKMMVTYWPYGTTTEVHGMADKAMHLYVGTKEDPLRIVRGGVFGGTLPYIVCATRAYLHAMAVTLNDGYLGTEENILAIAFARFPHLFHGFDNDSLGNHGDNCALFIKNTRDG